MGLRGGDLADCVDYQVEAMVMMDAPDTDMPLSDALVTIRSIAALIEEIGAYCPRCGGVLFDGVYHCCDLISAVKDESGATATANGGDLQAPDSPFDVL